VSRSDLYAPECAEGVFSEVRPATALGTSRKKLARAKEFEPVAAERRKGGGLTPTSQGLQDVLGASVLALWQPLAQLADYRARYAVTLEPPE
jgi:hypothetical protein